MIIKASEKKPFEQPDAGVFAGTIIDVVDLGLVKSTYNGETTEQQKIQVIWVLDKSDSQGRPFRIQAMYNANINMNPKSGKKSRLYELIEQIFGTSPSLEFESESLIGRSNQLFLVKETNATSNKVYTNIKGLLPLNQGQVGPKAPADFVRAKDRKQQTGGQTQAAKPAVTPAVAAAPATTQLPSNDASF